MAVVKWATASSNLPALKAAVPDCFASSAALGGAEASAIYTHLGRTRREKEFKPGKGFDEAEEKESWLE